jgi:hypothetical protein
MAMSEAQAILVVQYVDLPGYLGQKPMLPVVWERSTEAGGVMELYFPLSHSPEALANRRARLLTLGVSAVDIYQVDGVPDDRLWPRVELRPLDGAD